MKICKKDFAIFFDQPGDTGYDRYKHSKNRKRAAWAAGLYGLGKVAENMEFGGGVINDIIKGVGSVPGALVTKPVDAIAGGVLKGVSNATGITDKNIEKSLKDANLLKDGKMTVSKEDLYNSDWYKNNVGDKPTNVWNYFINKRKEGFNKGVFDKYITKNKFFSETFTKVALLKSLDFATNDDLAFINALSGNVPQQGRVIRLSDDKPQQKKGLSTGQKVALGVGGVVGAGLLAHAGVFGEGAKDWVDELGKNIANAAKRKSKPEEQKVVSENASTSNIASKDILKDPEEQYKEWYNEVKPNMDYDTWKKKVLEDVGKNNHQTLASTDEVKAYYTNRAKTTSKLDKPETPTIYYGIPYSYSGTEDTNNYMDDASNYYKYINGNRYQITSTNS